MQSSQRIRSRPGRRQSGASSGSPGGRLPALLEVLTPDAVTRWPHPASRSRVRELHQGLRELSGGPPTYLIDRIVGEGDVWVAELYADYGDQRWFTASICEFDGERMRG